MMFFVARSPSCEPTSFLPDYVIPSVRIEDEKGPTEATLFLPLPTGFICFNLLYMDGLGA